jgi:hypothetical protein
MKPQELRVSLGLPFGLGSISGTWGPDDAERRAAWEMYVELVTRISVEPLGPEEGLLREVLGSLYSLFGSTRDILRRYGPEVAIPKRGHELSFGSIAVTVLNRALRPCWHAGIPSLATTSRRDPLRSHRWSMRGTGTRPGSCGPPSKSCGGRWWPTRSCWARWPGCLPLLRGRSWIRGNKRPRETPGPARVSFESRWGTGL